MTLCAVVVVVDLRGMHDAHCHNNNTNLNGHESFAVYFFHYPFPFPFTIFPPFFFLFLFFFLSAVAVFVVRCYNLVYDGSLYIHEVCDRCEGKTERRRDDNSSMDGQGVCCTLNY